MLWNTLGIVLLVLLLIQLLRLVMAFSIFNRFRLTWEQSKVVPLESLSPTLVARIQRESCELPELGFAPVCVIESNEMNARADLSTHLAFFFQAETATYAIVHLTTAAGTTRSSIIYFVNYAEGEASLSYQTLPFKLEGSDVSLMPDSVIGQISTKNDVAGAYHEHLVWMEAGGIEANARLEPDQLARRHEAENRAILTKLIESGKVARVADDVYRYRPLTLLVKAVKSLMTNGATMKYLNRPWPVSADDTLKPAPAVAAGFPEAEDAVPPRNPEPEQSARNLLSARPAPADLIEEEIDRFRRQRSAKAEQRGSARSKAVWFLISIAAFIAIGGFFWSFRVAAILAAVVLFHELGHIAGMKLVGYRNLRILFIPMAGAVAMGNDDRPVAPWKQLVVLYAGPLPGILLGLGLLVWAAATGFESELLSQIVWILLVLNIFNLLPVYPLDGGQIFSLTFLGRFPFLKVVFLATSVAVLGLLWVVTRETVFGILALILGAGLISEYRTAQAVTRIRARLPRDFDRTDESMLLREIFNELRDSSASKSQPTDRFAIAGKWLKELRQKPAGLATMAGSAAAYTLPIWAPVLLLIPAAHLAQRQYEERRAEMIAAGWPSNLEDLAEQVTDEENALPHLNAARAMIESDAETAALVAEITRSLQDWLYREQPLTERQIARWRETLATPEISALINEISLAATKPTLEDPAWYREESVLLREGYGSFNPDEALILLGASALVAEHDERWARYLAALDLANLFAHHPLPSVRNQFYSGRGIVMPLPAELYRQGSSPTREEFAGATQRLAELKHGSEENRQRRVRANFVLSALTYDRFPNRAGGENADYDPETDVTFLSRIGRVFNTLNFDAFGKADELEKLKAISAAPVPVPLPNRYDFEGSRWKWILAIAGPTPVEPPLSWPQLIDYDIADFSALFGAADEIYRFKQENGEYPPDRNRLWERIAINATAELPLGDQPYYSRIDDGFELYVRDAYFNFADEAEEDEEEYDTTVYNTYWRGPDAVFPVWEY